METSTKPSLTVKANKDYVGSGWANEGKYGTYYTVKIDKDLPAGTTLFVAARKDSNVELEN